MALTKAKLIADGVIVAANLHPSHGITSANIGENTNLYFTNARARSAISVSGNALSYNSSTGVITSNFEESPTFTGNISLTNSTATSLSQITLAEDAANNKFFRLHYLNSSFSGASGTNIAASGLLAAGGAATGGIVIRTDAAAPIIFATNGQNNERMRINSDGKVGIGITSPQGKFTVVGTTQTCNFDLDANAEVGLSIMGLHTSNRVGITIGKSNASKMSGVLRYVHSSDGGNSNYVGIGHYAADDKLNITSGGNVGVGITTPSYPLEVAGAGTVSIAYQRTGVSAKKWGFHTDNSNTYWQNLTDNVLALTISNAGNVGIGNTSPDAFLHIGGAPAISAEALIVRGNANGQYAVSIEQDNSSGFGMIIDTDSTDSSDPAFKVQNPNGSLLDVRSNGNIGIGTTSPNDALEVAGNNSTQHRIRINNAGTGTATLAFMQGTTFKSWVEHNNSTGNFDVWQYTNNPMRFATNNTERMRIINNGNVGIGTISPAAKLDVSGSSALFMTRTSSGLATYIENDGGYSAQYMYQIGGGAKIALHTNGNSYFNGGNVGIGETNPSSALEVVDSTNYKGIHIRGNAAPNLTFGQNLDSTAEWKIGISGFNGDSFSIGTGTGANDKLHITNTGNVGIGVINPISLLTIGGATTNNPHAAADDVQIRTAIDGGMTISCGSDSGTGSIFFGDTSDNAKGQIRYNHNTDDLTITAADNIILSGDNVGIGTTSPDGKLEVAGGTTLGLRITNAGDSSAYDQTRITYSGFNSGSPEMVFMPLTTPGSGTVNTFFRFRNTNGANATNNIANVSIDGKLGIGTNTPNHKLDIYSNENVPLRIHRPSNANLNSSGAWGIGFSTRGDTINSTTDTRAGIFSYYNGNLFFATNTSSIVADPDASARMTILNTGYVGINTTNPLNQFDVRGAAYITGYTVGFDTSPQGNYAYRLTNDGGNSFINVQGGNLGIGTTSPNYKLEVNGSLKASSNIYAISTYALVLDSNNGSGPQLTFGSTSDNDSFGRIAQHASKFQFITQSRNFEWLNGSNSLMTLQTGGNLGIGETNPESILHIKDTNAEIRVATAADGQTARIALTEDADGDTHGGYMQYVGGGDTLRLGIINAGTNTDVLTIKDNFDVGIGTTSPTKKLDIRTDNGVLIKGATGSTNPNLTFVPASGGREYALANDSSSFFIKDVSADLIRMYFHHNGNTGIGTTSPSEILQTNKNSAGNVVGGYFTNSQANTGAESVSLAFGLNRSGGDFVRQTKAITFGAEQQWTGTPSTVDGYLAFSTMQNEATSEVARFTSSQYLRFASGTGGIQFNGDTAPANALDDYEEGTFTPAIGDGTYTYSYRRGHYQKIGNTVHIHIGFKINQASSVGTGVARITGLPFAGMSWGSYQEPHERVGAAGLCVTANLSYNLSFYISNGSAQLNGRTSANNNDTQVNSNQVWQDGTFIKLQLSYTVS